MNLLIQFQLFVELNKHTIVKQKAWEVGMGDMYQQENMTHSDNMAVVSLPFNSEQAGFLFLRLLALATQQTPAKAMYALWVVSYFCWQTC